MRNWRRHRGRCHRCPGRTKRFLLDQLEDRVHGGLFWSVTANGLPFEVEKHLYAQAFGIYGLSAYSRAFAHAEAAEAATDFSRRRGTAVRTRRRRGERKRAFPLYPALV